MLSMQVALLERLRVRDGPVQTQDRDFDLVFRETRAQAGDVVVALLAAVRAVDRLGVVLPGP